MLSGTHFFPSFGRVFPDQSLPLVAFHRSWRVWEFRTTGMAVLVAMCGREGHVYRARQGDVASCQHWLERRQDAADVVGGIVRHVAGGQHRHKGKQEYYRIVMIQPPASD